MIRNANALEAAAHRILTLSFVPASENCREGARLIVEWLHRMALWTAKLGLSREWPYPNLVNALAQRVELPDGLRDTLQRHYADAGLTSRTIIGFLDQFLCWEYMRDEPAISCAWPPRLAIQPRKSPDNSDGPE